MAKRSQNKHFLLGLLLLLTSALPGFVRLLIFVILSIVRFEENVHTSVNVL